MTCDTPPPCAEACWERLPGGWRYTASSTQCGHHYDPHTRIWRWNNRTTT